MFPAFMASESFSSASCSRTPEALRTFHFSVSATVISCSSICNCSVSRCLNSFFSSSSFSSSPLTVAAVCSPVVVFSSFPNFFVLPPSVPCIYCKRLVQCVRLTKAGVIDTLVTRLPLQRIASFTRRTALMVPSHNLARSAVTTFLFVEKPLSASAFPCDSARPAITTLPDVLYLRSPAAVLIAITFDQY